MSATLARSCGCRDSQELGPPAPHPLATLSNASAPSTWQYSWQIAVLYRAVAAGAPTPKPPCHVTTSLLHRSMVARKWEWMWTVESLAEIWKRELSIT